MSEAIVADGSEDGDASGAQRGQVIRDGTSGSRGGLGTDKADAR
jgi:hypothetical protein